ncbi:MAG: hypothetical protein ACI9XO_001043 [Paraglaciecola sp.]|jgi:hypothetical protein
MKIFNVFFLAFATFILSCVGANHADNPLMQKAYAIHQESSKIEQEIAPKLEELIQLKNSKNTVGTRLTETEINRIEKIEAMEHSLKSWQKNLPDVPEFEQEHQAHDGPCNHSPKLELLPEDWVKVQQEFKDSILMIKERIEGVLK